MKNTDRFETMVTNLFFKKNSCSVDSLHPIIFLVSNFFLGSPFLKADHSFFYINYNVHYQCNLFTKKLNADKLIT